MYSDSDDSQISQPHLFIKKKQSISSKGEDVVDREKKDLIVLDSSTTTNLIDIEDDQNIKASSSSMVYKSTKSPIDLLLMKSSSDSKSESDLEIDESSISSETGLGDNYSIEDEIYKKYFNKSQQTSPTILGSLNKLESPVRSPEIEPLKSKYIKNLHQQRFNLKQSFESLNSRIDSRLELESKFSTRYESVPDINLPKKRQQYGIFNFEFDEELFYKVKKLFPHVKDEKIRTFMFKHHNQEHDVIAATIKSLSPKRERKRLKHQTQMDKVLGHYSKEHKQIDQLDEERKRLALQDEDQIDHDNVKVQIKITYLKLLYPESDVLEIFYLLHEYDMKANIVAKKLEEKGYRRNSLSESEISLANSFHYEELMPELKLTFGEQQERIRNLKKEFPLIDDYLIETALVCTRFDIEEARKLLQSADMNEYKNTKTYEYNFKIDDSNFIYLNDRSVQTSLIDYYEFGNSYKIERPKNRSKIKTKR